MVGRVPEQVLISFVGHDVVYHRGKPSALGAKGVGCQELYSIRAPSVVVPSLVGCPSVAFGKVLVFLTVAPMG